MTASSGELDKCKNQRLGRLFIALSVTGVAGEESNPRIGVQVKEEGRNPRPLWYARADPRPRRRSWLAVGSVTIAILALPVMTAVTQLLQSIWPPRRAELVAFTGFVLIAILGLATAALSMQRIRKSSGALHGRRVALVEIFPKAVDGRANSSGLSFAVDEHDAVDQVF
jgi:hypothetical protein